MTRPTLFTTLFVAEPARLPEAEARYARRVAALPGEHGSVVSVDQFAVPCTDEFHLWDLRATACYEQVPNAESLELFQLSCAVAGATEQTAEYLFFCGPNEPDPFPGSVSVGGATAVESATAPELIDGTWLVTLYSLYAESLSAAVDTLMPMAASEPVAEFERHDIFGLLVLTAIRARPEVFAPGLPRLRQRLIVRHSGAPRLLVFDRVVAEVEALNAG